MSPILDRSILKINRQLQTIDQCVSINGLGLSKADFPVGQGWG
jgi:hypothetical protein